MIRFFDLFFSILGLIVLFPVLFLVGLLIKLTSRGGIFFVQERVGKDGKLFKLIKFRSMRINQNSTILITVGNDSRITPIGHIIRKFKIDELPQLINVLKGEMSIVGPRPEVKKYVDLYSDNQRKVLSIKPGITDYASIYFINESLILSESKEPEDTYVKIILPEKNSLSMYYVENKNVYNYFKVIFITIFSIFKTGNVLKKSTFLR